MIKLLALILLSLSNFAHAEQINVKHRGILETEGTGLVDYPETKDRWAIHRVLFDEVYSYLVIEVGHRSYSRAFYHYCDVPKSVVEEMMAHSSASKYFSHEIKGKYDCRINPTPPY